MAQHDYIIDNGSGSAVRADINTLLQAVVSQNSDDTEPSTKYAFQLWADTSTNQLKLRNSGNTGWDIVGALDTQNLGLMLASVFPNVNDTVDATDEELNKLYLATSTASANKVVITDGNTDINLGTGDFNGTNAVLTGDIVTSLGQFGNNTTDPKAEIDLGDTLTGFPSVMSRGKGANELDYAVPDGDNLHFGHHSGLSGGGTTRLTLESDGDLTLHGSGKFRGDGSALTGVSTTSTYWTDSASWSVVVPNGVTQAIVTASGAGGGGGGGYGSGGNTGALIFDYPISVTAGNTISGVCGAGGNGASSWNANGSQGGSTTITGSGLVQANITLGGGKGGIKDHQGPPSATTASNVTADLFLYGLGAKRGSDSGGGGGFVLGFIYGVGGNYGSGNAKGYGAGGGGGGNYAVGGNGTKGFVTIVWRSDNNTANIPTG